MSQLALLLCLLVHLKDENVTLIVLICIKLQAEWKKYIIN